MKGVLLDRANACGKDLTLRKDCVIDHLSGQTVSGKKMAGKSDGVVTSEGLPACQEVEALELSIKESLFGDHNDRISSNPWYNSDSTGCTAVKMLSWTFFADSPLT
jgi:hypothetical protein